MSVKKCTLCNDSHAIAGINLDFLLCEVCINKVLKEHFSRITPLNVKTLVSHSGKNLINEDLVQYIIGFGKNKGKRILDVEPNYIKWCLENFEGLRDVDVFQEALHKLTGEKVENPAALALNNKNKAATTDSEEMVCENPDFPFK